MASLFVVNPFVSPSQCYQAALLKILGSMACSASPMGQEHQQPGRSGKWLDQPGLPNGSNND